VVGLAALLRRGGGVCVCVWACGLIGRPQGSGPSRSAHTQHTHRAHTHTHTHSTHTHTHTHSTQHTE
jgi:hypothetical protein